MPRFKSKQSQKASEDWFRKHITKKEQVSQPDPSKGQSHGFEHPPGLNSARGGPPPERFFFQDSDSDSDSDSDWADTEITCANCLTHGRSGSGHVDENTSEAHRDYFGQTNGPEDGDTHGFGFGFGGQSEQEALLQTRYGRVIVPSAITCKSLIIEEPEDGDTHGFGFGFGGQSEQEAELRTLSARVIVPPTVTSDTRYFGGRSNREAKLRTRDEHVIVPPAIIFNSLIVEEPEEGESKNEFVKESPTDAFGTVCFVGMGNKEAEYTRLSSDTKPEVLYELLTKQWELSPPNLLISVTGGTDNFYLKPHLKNMFHRGLIKVAQTTGAWILTGGTNSGVVKHVGQALRDQALSSSQGRSIVAIGVATWGTIHNRHMLVNPESPFRAKYVVDVEGQGPMRALEHNHTHFLLVDDGTEGRHGAEIALRARLEKHISDEELPNQENGVKIPVVLVVLNGDPGTLNIMYNAMQDGTPCVVLEGSGGMADVVAHVVQLPMNQINIVHIRELMETVFGRRDFGLSIIEWTKKIQDMTRMLHLLTVFRVTADGDVDVAILHALLNASRSREGGESYQRQLELAVAWNRVDIANDILTAESQWKPEQLHSAMSLALFGNKPGLVSLLLENGVSLKDFLQEETLYDLYKKMPNCLFLRRLAKRKRSRPLTIEDQTTFINHVSDEAQQLLKSCSLPILPPQSRNRDEMEMSTVSVSGTFLQSGNPERDLFLWAILHNNKELAEIAWEKCEDCMVSALAASKILKKLGGKVDREGDADEGKGLKELADLYEKRAIDVFSECYSCDEERAQKLLLRKSPLWDGSTCLSLALEANNQNFIAQSGVQALLTQIWCGELSVENPVWRVLVCIIVFPLIYTRFLDFRRDEEIQREAEKNEAAKALEIMTKNPHEERMKEQEVTPLVGCARLVSLYSSLQVKFYLHIASYLAFLTLFAMVLMVYFHPSPSVLEILLYVWTFSLACEEIRQLFYDPYGLGCRKKAKLYICDFWNVLDVLSIVLFILGVALRFDDDLFYAGKIVLCIDFVIFCLRLMAIFTINQTLGPKIIIVRQMMKDMFFFMFLLSIWVVAYGVAKQGILIDNEDRLGWILRGAVYEPYLTIFGDMPSNIDHTEFDISTCSMNGSDALKPKCPVLNEDEMPAFPEWLTIIMLCVYLLFANILLLNLLIAILSFTFQVVQDNTDRIWKFQRYELIYEYHSRPHAPPPFLLFCHLSKLLRAVLRRLRKACTKSRESRCVIRQSDEEVYQREKELLYWEAVMKDQYLASTKQAQMQSTEQRIHDTHHKVEMLLLLFSFEYQRLDQLQKQLQQVVLAQGRHMDSVESDVVQPVTAPSLNMTPGDFTDSHFLPSETMEGFHVRARQSPYPGVGWLVRFPVPEEMVRWEACFSCYNPPFYSSPDTEDDTERSGFKEHNHFRNPVGRTGLCGRGVLSRLGPNRSLDLILTRWRDDAYFEFLTLKDENDESLIFPGGEVDSAGCLPAVLETTMGKDVCQKIKKEPQIYKVHTGYVDDHRNTDNAWVETTVLHINLNKDSSLLTDISSLVTQSQGSERPFEWQEVSGRARLSSQQRDFLKIVALWHSSRF